MVLFFFLKKGFCFLENGRMIFVSVFFFFGKSGIEVFPLPSPKASIFRTAYASWIDASPKFIDQEG